MIQMIEVSETCAIKVELFNLFTKKSMKISLATT